MRNRLVSYQNEWLWPLFRGHIKVMSTTGFRLMFCDWLSQQSIGYHGKRFYRSKDPTDSIKVVKEHKNTQITQKYNKRAHTYKKTENPLVCTNMWWLGDGFHRGQGRQPEQRWDCRRGRPTPIRCWISRKPLEIEAWFQRTTNWKWHVGYQMVTWPMTSHDPEMSNSWL